MAKTTTTELSTRVKRPARGRSELIAALAEARSGISKDASDIGDFVNVPKRIRTSLAEATGVKVAPALAAGLLGSQFFKKKRKGSEEEKAGWLSMVFPEFDLKKIIHLLLKSYLEPDQVDLKAIIRERLREFLK